MTLYSQIKQYLDYGLMVVVVDNQGILRVFHRLLPDGYLELTYSGSTIDDSLKCGSEMLHELQINKNNYNWHIHSLLPRPITPYPVGMKVRVDESYLKIEDRYELVEEIETIDYVKVTSEGSFKYRLEESSAWVDHRFLIPVIEEKSASYGGPGALTKEDWLSQGRHQGWIKGGEVIE